MNPSPPNDHRVTADRQHMLRGRGDLEWFFANRRWLKLSSNIIHVAYARRPRPETECALQFLLVATKRDYKRAHDRNKIKRWLRAAIAETETFGSIEAASSTNQLLVMLRISRPMSELDYEVILAALSEAAMRLQQLKPAGNQSARPNPLN